MAQPEQPAGEALPDTAEAAAPDDEPDAPAGQAPPQPGPVPHAVERDGRLYRVDPGE